MSGIEEIEKADARRDKIFNVSLYLVGATSECVLGALMMSMEVLTLGAKFAAGMFFVIAGIFLMNALYAFEKKRNWHR